MPSSSPHIPRKCPKMFAPPVTKSTSRSSSSPPTQMIMVSSGATAELPVPAAKADAEAEAILEPTKEEQPQPQEPSPVTALKLIFSKTEAGRISLKRPAKCVFNKPSQEAIDAYNIRAVRAIREKNVPILRTMLEEGVSLDACNRFGESLIHMACRRGDVNVVKFLLLEGRVDITVRDDFGRTPIHDACWTAEPNFNVMDVLLDHAPTDLLLAEDVRGHTPLHYARKEHWGSWVSYFNEREDKLCSLLTVQHNIQQVVG